MVGKPTDTRAGASHLTAAELWLQTATSHPVWRWCSMRKSRPHGELILTMSHWDWRKPAINAGRLLEFNQQSTTSPAGDAGADADDLCVQTNGNELCITRLLSCPVHHVWPPQPCFHTLTMRVKACTHGCLWATSVTFLPEHTLGLERKRRKKKIHGKYLTCHKMFSCVSADVHDSPRDWWTGKKFPVMVTLGKSLLGLRPIFGLFF